MPAVAGAPLAVEHRLSLLGWLLSLLGYESTGEMLDDLSTSGEGFDASGRSYVYSAIVGRGTQVAIPTERLEIYDENIKRHLEQINRRRSDPFTLRYFQYLALLFAEIYLDHLSSSEQALAQALTAWVGERNARRAPGDPVASPFSAQDLTRLAYWMATGSGKTLLMHINYLQYKYYFAVQRDNVLLITPNEGLSEQHLAELHLSGIPAERFAFDNSGLTLSEPDTVRIVEITKLVDEKRGGGVTVPVEYFDGRNLLFVDEGHKGAGGDTWRRYRDVLATTGFTFEYSATFGQALTAARNDPLTEAYGKWIIFDYSYRYFHGDGYGKEFQILNVERTLSDFQQRTLLTANLLTFLEQKLRYEHGREQLAPYHLADPLWVFVGSSVNAVRTEGGRETSDVLTVLRFLHAFLDNRQQTAVRTVDRILKADSGLTDAGGRDVFADRFVYLRSIYGEDGATVYADALSKVFNVSGSGGGLVIRDLQAQTGELGLQAASGQSDFGVVYVGDTSRLKKLIDEHEPAIAVQDDVVSDSLFSDINHRASPIKVLIGAKKFVEGWSSWRVTSMCLLNIGRSEGAEVIQLFGRGVRLLGLNRSLRRSRSLDGQHPAHIALLETLQIFSVRASYMAQFRTYLEREGVDPSGALEIPLAVRPNREFLAKRLVVPRLSGTAAFAEQESLVLQPDPAAVVRYGLAARWTRVDSSTKGFRRSRIQGGEEVAIPSQLLSYVDWQAVFDHVVAHKVQKGFSNLAITQPALRQVMEATDPRLYRLQADRELLNPSRFADTEQLTGVVAGILKRYLEKYYRVCQERWESNNMVYGELTDADPNFRDYVVKVARSAVLIKAVEDLLAEAQRLYEAESRELPRIHFDRHLFQPLLADQNAEIKSDPPGLGASELQFVSDLRAYLLAKQSNEVEIFLLRNLSRGRGVGFFESEGFYPDFILWLRDAKGNQRIVFVEPHGMLHEKAYWTSDKAQLHVRLAALTETWKERTPGPDVVLDAYIVSKTPYGDLRPHYASGAWTLEDFARRHILFFEDARYVERIVTAAADQSAVPASGA